VRASLAFFAILFAGCGSNSEPADTGATSFDAGFRDLGSRDADPEPDLGSSEPDALEEREAGALDAEEPPDTGEIDSGLIDSGVIDSGPPDTGACVPRMGGEASTSSTPPALLSETGLYTNTASKSLSPTVEPFAPKYVLWSDGAEKTRWVELPDCSVIDTSDMDHWVVPVGTKFFKEFKVGGRRIETRLIKRYGPAVTDFYFAAYAWDEDEREAHLVPLGVQNALGTRHDIPPTSFCRSCHGGLPERTLGFGAIQLSHPGPGVTIASLSNEGRLTVPAPMGFELPGDPIDQEAVGYLHANCGNCHNDTSYAIPFTRSFVLRASVTSTSVETTGVYRTAVGQRLERFTNPTYQYRIVAGTSSASAVVFRMSQRGSPRVQMPPIATEIIDPTGLDLVRMWIDQL
jgi:hypothetical protein